MQEELTAWDEAELKGRVEQAKSYILALGTRKFGEPTKEVQEALEEFDLFELEQLDRLHYRILEVGSWKELLETS